MNLDNIDNMFFIGIGGMGMSSLAEYFVNEKKYVGGYDRDISENTDRLQKLGIKILFNDWFESAPIKGKSSWIKFFIFSWGINSSITSFLLV